MRNLCKRQSFCEALSQSVVKHLNQEFKKDVCVEKCLFQRTRHPIKRKTSGFSLSKALVTLLSRKFCRDNASDFYTGLETCLSAMVTESQSWEIPALSWHKEGENYEVEVDKAMAFKIVVQGILSFSNQTLVRSSTIEETNCNIFCHVNEEPNLDDIRSILYSSLLNKNSGSKHGSAIFMSSNHELDKQKYIDVLNALHLDKSSFHFAKETSDYDCSIKSNESPERFSDCTYREDKETPKHLMLLQRQDNQTAFLSKISSRRKHIACSCFRRAFEKNSNDSVAWVHVCNWKNIMLAQQSELFHAWYKDKISLAEYLHAEDIDANCNWYFCHAGIQDCDKLDVIAFLELRKRQIKKSFEAKLQVNLKGEDWNSIFDKMRAAVIRLEFFHQSAFNRMKLSVEEDSLPSDATFLLYNYSRLSMLLDSYLKRVEEGYYPPLCKFDEVDFSSLVENAEWELLINHLWNFYDTISKPLTTSNEWNVKINCHHVVDYLQQLCRSVSAFYSRHHILGENLPHLITAMNARIYLMKAAKKIATEVFDFLGVEPLAQM